LCLEAPPLPFGAYRALASFEFER